MVRSQAALYWLASAGLLFPLALLSTRSTSGAAYGPREEARSLLRTCLAAQRVMDNVEYHTITAWTVSSPVDPDPTLGLLAQHAAWFRRQDKALDVATNLIYLDAERAAKEPHRRARYVVNEKHFALHSQREGEKKPLGPRASKKNKEKFWQHCIGMPQTGTFLDGYLDGCGDKRLAEILLEEDAAVLRGEEMVDNVRCIAIVGKTKYGRITLWLDRQHNCVPLKATCERGADDFYHDEKQNLTRISDQAARQFYRQTRLQLIGVSSIVDQITLKMINGHYIPIKGRYVGKELFPDGKVSMAAYTTNRSDIQISPSFEGTDAFRMEVPENESVNNLDDQSGVAYVWRDGDFRPAQPQELRRLAADLMSGQRSHWSIIQAIAWSVGGTLLLLLSAWIAYRRIRSKAGA